MLLLCVGHMQKTWPRNIMCLLTTCRYLGVIDDDLQVVVLLNDKPITAYSFGSGMFKTT